MVHAAVRAGGAGGRAVPGGIRRRHLDLVTTPGRLWLVLAGLVLLGLAWGALATFTAVQYASAASSVVTTREPLSLAAQQIYARLSDANDAAATAFLSGGIEPAGTRQRYLADISAAGSEIESATAQVGSGSGPAGQDLAALAVGLPAYTQEMGNAQADNRLALPLGAAYLREASTLMRGTLLKNAKGLYEAENASLRATSAQATGPAPRRGNAGRRRCRRLPPVPGVTLAARAHQPGDQRRRPRRRAPAGRLAGLAGRARTWAPGAT